MTEKPKLHFSVKLFIGYCLIAMLLGVLTADGFGYSLITFFFLTPILASFSVYQLTTQHGWIHGAVALVLYAAINNLMPIVSFGNALRINTLYLGLVFFPGLGALLLGLLHTTSSTSDHRSRAWLLPCLLFAGCALILFVAGRLSTAAYPPVILFFVLPLMTFVFAMHVGTEASLAACGGSLVFFVAAAAAVAYLVPLEGMASTVPFALIVGAAGALVGIWLKRRNARTTA